MLWRLAHLTVTNAVAVLRLLPMSDRDKDAEILAMRHQIAVTMMAHRHAVISRPKHQGRPRTVRSVRALVLRVARENPSQGYRPCTATCWSWE